VSLIARGKKKSPRFAELRAQAIMRGSFWSTACTSAVFTIGCMAKASTLVTALCLGFLTLSCLLFLSSYIYLLLTSRELLQCSTFWRD